MIRPLDLILPYPVSANRYWRSLPPAGRRAAVVVLSREAKLFKEEVVRRAAAAGITAPVRGRVCLTIDLYPAMPKDGPVRMRRDPVGWDDTVRAIDVDNGIKVVLDSIKGIVIDDDRWVRRIVAQRHAPTGDARTIVRIEPFDDTMRAAT